MFGGIMLITQAVFRSSDVYKTAVQKAEANEQIKSLLGTPMSASRFVTGSMHTIQHGEEAQLEFKILGPKTAAVVFVEATKSGGVWTYSVMRVYVVSTGQVIDLRESIQ